MGDFNPVSVRFEAFFLSEARPYSGEKLGSGLRIKESQSRGVLEKGMVNSR
jgi:hypothetical protein